MVRSTRWRLCTLRRERASSVSSPCRRSPTRSTWRTPGCTKSCRVFRRVVSGGRAFGSRRAGFERGWEGESPGVGAPARQGEWHLWVAAAGWAPRLGLVLNFCLWLCNAARKWVWFEFCAWRGGAVGRLPHPSEKLGLVLNSCYTDFGWMPEIGFGSYFGQFTR